MQCLRQRPTLTCQPTVTMGEAALHLLRTRPPTHSQEPESYYTTVSSFSTPDYRRISSSLWMVICGLRENVRPAQFGLINLWTSKMSVSFTTHNLRLYLLACLDNSAQVLIKTVAASDQTFPEQSDLWSDYKDPGRGLAVNFLKKCGEVPWKK